MDEEHDVTHFEAIDGLIGKYNMSDSMDEEHDVAEYEADRWFPAVKGGDLIGGDGLLIGLSYVWIA